MPDECLRQNNSYGSLNDNMLYSENALFINIIENAMKR